MKFNIRTTILATVTAFFAVGNGSTFAVDPAHWIRALQYTVDIDAINNEYGSNCDIYYDENDQLQARSMCGSYVAKVHRQSYPTLKYSVMSGLFEWGSPNARRWYDGIIEERTYTNYLGTFGATSVTSVWNLAPGDILVSKYSSGSASGHVMMAGSVSSEGVTAVSEIPGYTEAEVCLVGILDCTSTPHGATDSRKGAEPDLTDDQGIGRGEIYILADPGTGNMIGWTWSANLSHTIYQCTDPDADNYRPVIGGFLYGPGI